MSESDPKVQCGKRATLFRLWTGSSYVVQIKRCVRDRVFAVIPAATGRGTYLTRDTRKALYCMLAKARKLQLPIDIQCQLFDNLVLPVLLYGSEVWGGMKICCKLRYFTGNFSD